MKSPTFYVLLAIYALCVFADSSCGAEPDLQAMPDSVSVQGFVRDIEGNPIEGAVVNLVIDSVAVHSTETDVNGYYQMITQWSFDSRKKQLHVFKQGMEFNDSLREVCLKPNLDHYLEFVEAAYGSVVGAVMTDEGIPLVDISVTVAGRDHSKFVRSTRTDSAGNYEISLPAGMAELTISSDRDIYIFQSSTINVVEGETSKIDVVAMPGGSIVGTVKSVGASGGKVRLYDINNNLILGSAHLGEGENLFRFGSLQSSQYRLSFHAEHTSKSVVVNIPSDLYVTNVIIDLSPSTSSQSVLAGVIVPAGAMGSGDVARISLVDTRSGNIVASKVLSTGELAFTFSGLQPGNYGVIATMGAHIGRRSITLSSGERITDVELVLGKLE